MNNWPIYLLSILLLVLLYSCKGEVGKCKLKKCKEIEAKEPCTPCNDKDDYVSKCIDSDNGQQIKCHDLVAHFNNFSCQSMKDSLTLTLKRFEGDANDELLAFQQINAETLYSMNVSCDSIEILKLTIDLKLYHLLTNDKIQLAIPSPDQDTLKHIYNNSTMKKCLCEEDLFLYNNPVIEMENEVVTATNKPKMKGEGGGKLSLNYIIEPEGDMPPRFARLYNKGRMQNRYLTSDTSTLGPIVAFLDSGMDPELFAQNKYFNDNQEVCIDDVYQSNQKGWNFIGENNITHDDVGHGTLVAQSFKILMLEDDDYTVLPIKVLDSCGYGTMYSTVCGLYFAKEKNADILNCSWGMYVNDTIMERAIETVSANAIIVTSAGNKGEDLTQFEHYPSEYSWRNSGTELENVYEVAGLCHHYTEETPIRFEYWFNSNFNEKNLAESAVGYHDLISEIPNSIKRNNYDNDCTCNGTSYAAPRVTAAAAAAAATQNHVPYTILKIPERKVENCTYVPKFEKDDIINGE